MVVFSAYLANAEFLSPMANLTETNPVRTAIRFFKSNQSIKKSLFYSAILISGFSLDFGKDQRIPAKNILPKMGAQTMLASN